MKNKLNLSLTWALVLTLSLSSTIALADAPESALPPLPDLHGIAADPEGPGVELDPAVNALIEKKIEDRRSAPQWVKRLQLRTLRSYFGSPGPADQKLPQDQVIQIEKDAAALADYYEQNDSEHELKDVSESTIKPLLERLTWGKFLSKIRRRKLTEPIGDWTVEGLVVRSDVKFLAKFRDRAKRALELITGPHLRSAAKTGLVLAMTGGILYAFRDYGGYWLYTTVTVSVVAGFRSGPVATLINALNSWWINPTVEWLTVIANRVTAPWERALNRVYDRAKTTTKTAEEAAAANETPKIGAVSEDGTNYGGQTEADQLENWQIFLHMWVYVCKHFYRLLRGTQQAGRSLLHGAWNDETNAAQFAEILDSKLATLSVEELQLLTPYQTGFIVSAKPEQKDRLDEAFENFRDLCARTWEEQLNEDELNKVRDGILEAQTRLRELGLSDLVIRKLWKVQIERAHAAQVLATGVALSEMKLLANAEANRNFPDIARQTQRVLHRGFSVQRFVEAHRTGVVTTQRAMGFKNSGAIPVEPTCQVLLEKLVPQP